MCRYRTYGASTAARIYEHDVVRRLRGCVATLEVHDGKFRNCWDEICSATAQQLRKLAMPIQNLL